MGVRYRDGSGATQQDVRPQRRRGPFDTEARRRKQRGTLAGSPPGTDARRLRRPHVGARTRAAARRRHRRVYAWPPTITISPGSAADAMRELTPRDRRAGRPRSRAGPGRRDGPKRARAAPGSCDRRRVRASRPNPSPPSAPRAPKRDEPTARPGPRRGDPGRLRAARRRPGLSARLRRAAAAGGARLRWGDVKERTLIARAQDAASRAALRAAARAARPRPARMADRVRAPGRRRARVPRPRRRAMTDDAFSTGAPEWRAALKTAGVPPNVPYVLRHCSRPCSRTRAAR